MIDEPRAPPPPLDFRDIEAKYSQHDGDLRRFRKGYFQTPDGKLLAILVRPPESVTGYAQNRALLDGIKAEIERLKPQSYDPKLKIGFDGEVGSVVEEQEALVADLASSTVIVIVFVLLALWIYFRRWSAIAAIFGSLVVGCAVLAALTLLPVVMAGLHGILDWPRPLAALDSLRAGRAGRRGHRRVPLAGDPTGPHRLGHQDTGRQCPSPRLLG